MPAMSCLAAKQTPSLSGVRCTVTVHMLQHSHHMQRLASTALIMQAGKHRRCDAARLGQCEGLTASTALRVPTWQASALQSRRHLQPQRYLLQGCQQQSGFPCKYLRKASKATSRAVQLSSCQLAAVTWVGDVLAVTPSGHLSRVS